MEMRSKAYPPLPKAHGLRLVLPRTGDLRYRAQVPQAFAQRLYIHADPRRRFWYSRFQLTRKFIVMSTQGDLYAKRSVATFTMADLPKQNVLSMPRVARGDLVKVLDYALCSRSEGQQHWEIVFTRWRNGMETWLPLEVVQLFAPELLQEFYVNSINSWAFHQRVHAGNLAAYRTEVELWLFHPEFQEFYKRLRQKRAGGGAPTPTAQAQHQPIQSSHNVRVKAEQAAASAANTPRTAPEQQPPQQVQPAARNDPSEAVILGFEQRRLARERLDQLTRSQRNQLARQQAVQQAEQQRRLEREQQEQLRQGQEQQERDRRLQHERQRQKAHEELQKKQREYQERLRAQQEREKMTELQKQEQERLKRAKEQDMLRRRLQQEKLHQPAARKRPPASQSPQKSATRTQLRHKEHQTHSSSQPLEHKGHNASSIWTKDGDDEYVPPEESESESGDSDVSAYSDTSEDSLSDQRTRKRRRKRLLYSQVELDDEDDDDLPDLSQPPPSTRRKSMRRDASEDEVSDRKSTRTSKKRKRLRQPMANGGDTRSVEVDLTQLSEEEADNDDNSVELATPTPVVAPEEGKESNGNAQANSVDAELVDTDADADDDVRFEPSMIVGEIRCVCGATSVGAYRGEWLQCWKEDCGVWEHADCVGFLTSFESYPPPKYVCTRCDPEAYLARCVDASNRILDWLFQCCDSRNTKQLMELLEDNTGAAKLPSDWKNEHLEGRTLAMQAARNGLVKCLRYLMDKRKVDVFATDSQSRNVLHHAALGGSVVCCRVLLKRDRKLLLHQDLRGRMPFHYMLQSAKVNQLCLPFIREDSALVGMGDLNSNFPVHYACQAVNRYTVRICRMIFNSQPSMVQEKSSDGLSPVMILCKSAGRASMSQNMGEVTQSAKDVIALMLDIDVFGDCLNEKAPNGWSPLHFAAAAGNHELVTHLCNTELFDVQEPAKGTRLTALHIAAEENHPLCIRALLVEGFDVVAKDTDGWIPMLYAENTECIQEFMHYKLTKQLSRLHRMLSKYQQRGLVRRWQRLVARDPTCFDILNDWCQVDTERIERMEGLLLSNPFLLRLDNKIEYVRTYIIPSIKSSPGEGPVGSENGTSGTATLSKVQKKLAFVFSRGSGCFWKQFVGMGMCLEPEDFRLPILFSIERGGSSQGSDNRDSNLKLVLIRLAAGLLKEFPGLLVRGSNGELNKTTLSSDKQKLAAQLLGFYMLGELAAHFVLFSVPLSGILDFAPGFLRCIGCKGLYKSASDASWENAGRSFSAGFEAVLPATLDIFLADDLRVLFNGPETSFNALQIDWNSAVNGAIEESDVAGGQVVENAKAWLPRLVCELVKEEQQLLLLFMADTFQLINERFFRSEGGAGGIAVASYPDTDGVLDHDVMYPSMEHKPDILRLPSYSSYAAFKKAMLTVIRHANQAFRPE